MTKRPTTDLTPAAVLAVLRLLSQRQAARTARLSPITRLRGGTGA